MKILLILICISILVFFAYKAYKKDSYEFELIITKAEETKENAYRLNQEIEKIKQEIKEVNENYTLVKADLNDTSKELNKLRIFDFLHRDEKNKARELVKEAKQDLNLVKRELVTLTLK